MPERDLGSAIYIVSEGGKIDLGRDKEAYGGGRIGGYGCCCLRPRR